MANSPKPNTQLKNNLTFRDEITFVNIIPTRQMEESCKSLFIIPVFECHGILRPYQSVPPSAISSTLYTTLQCREGVACHRTWVAGLFRLQYRVLPVLAFVPAGRVLGPERKISSRIRSSLQYSAKDARNNKKRAQFLNQLKERSIKCHVFEPL
jgi:hypothetical protein